MLSYFNIKNFKSIIDLSLNTSFDEGKAPNNYKNSPYNIFFENTIQRVVPLFAIYGANASGKSNIISAINTFLRLVFYGHDEYIYEPNKLNPKYDNTHFEICFILDNDKYIYSITYNQNGILSEELFRNEENLFKCENSKLNNFVTNSEVYTIDKINEIYNVECKDSKSNQRYSLLSRIGKQYANLNKEITSAYTYLENRLLLCFNGCTFSNAIEKLSKVVESEEKAISLITDLIKKMDIDIEHIEVEHKKSTLSEFLNQSKYRIKFYNHKNNTIDYDEITSYHKDVNNESVKFNFETEESLGTNILAGILGYVLTALKTGSVLVIDELDRSMHPMLLTQIVRLFRDKRYNQTNAQLIFTSHCTDILDIDLLRISEIAILTKTKAKGTILKKVSKYEGIRNVTNFRRRYLSNEFSGIPQAYV